MSKRKSKADLYRLENGWDRERKREEAAFQFECEIEYLKQFGHGDRNVRKKDKLFKR